MGQTRLKFWVRKEGKCELTRGSVFKIFESVEAILTISKERY
jgi:hypothetical protein